MILSALNDYYYRLLDREADGIAPFGYSQEKISFALVLLPDGAPVDVQNIQDTSGKKPRPTTLTVPQPPKRAVNIAPCFLWDKAGYVLGVTESSDEKSIERTRKTHEVFKQYHLSLLKGSQDPALKALVHFLETWSPEDFYRSNLFREEMFDKNFVIRVDNDAKEYLHQRPEAVELVSRTFADSGTRSGRCLVTGELGPLARLHPSVKGVNGSQPTGASVASFNDDAYLSYRGTVEKLRAKQKRNDTSAIAPVSTAATFAYTTALNYLLRRDEDNRQRLQVGDTTVVFWAKAENTTQAQSAEMLFGDFFQPPAATDESETTRLRSALDAIAKGRPLSDLYPELEPSTEIFVLGLAPNASRLSIRFWEHGSLAVFAERLAKHYGDLSLIPCPWKTEPAIWRLLLETVPHREGAKRKLDDIQPLLAGEMARAVLSGSRYPRSLLTNLIMRMRADGDISSLRVALCKGVLARDRRLGVKGIEKEVPVSLETENTDPGYLLGRLFATLENVQQAALGKNVNATIRDRYYGAASATPAHVFPVLLRNTQHNLSKVRKEKPGLAVNLEKQLGEIVDHIGSTFPRSLRIEAQGRFAIGYYHQTQARFSNPDANNEKGNQ